MRKIYLCAIALSISSLSFGQSLYEPIGFRINDLAEETKVNEITPNNKALGAVIWNDDFDTPSDWVADNSAGPGGAQFGWTIDATSDGWWSTGGITSTSGGNYAELANGDPTISTQALLGTGDYTLTTTTSIDLIALGGVGSENSTLEFNQYGARFNDLMEIQLSTDGSNFITIGDNFDFDVHSSSASNIWPNPSLKRINLAPHLNGTTAQTVWLRFRWTTNFPSQPTNPMVWVTYGWYIDDLVIRTSPDNELQISDAYYGTAGLQYTRVPVAQIQPIDFIAQAINAGTADQVNTILTADVNSGAFSVASTPQTVVAGSTDSLVTATWTPPVTTGIPYNFTLTLSSDSTDDVPTNNSATFPPSEVSQYIYALDDFGATTPGNGGGYDSQTSPPIEEFEAGNFYDIFVNAQVYVIEVVVGMDADVGSAIDAVVYDWTTGSPVEVDRAFPYVITAGDLGTTLYLSLPTNPTLTAGNTYFAAVHSFGGGSEFFYGTSGTSPDGSGTAAQASLIFYPDMVNGTQNYYTSQTPMVRLNFDPSVGVDKLGDNDFGFNVYPNPSAGLFNVNLTATEAYDAVLTVKNVVGQTIINKTVAVAGQTTETISLSDYSKGIYFLTVGNETVKLIVE